jgi:oligopeptide/dipeptide ABC transporter ATP-binding protein
VTSPLVVRDLKVRFHVDHAVVNAVNGVSFSLERGKTLAIVGESGSGKSVTCLSLMRLLPPSAEVSGSVLLDGRDLLTLRDSEVRKVRGKDIALVYQDPMAALNPVRTIGAQIREPLRTHLGLSRRQADARAAELLGLVGIPAPQRQLRSYPHEFSGGMRQRAVIAMALACNPKVLLADEPTTALDVSVQAQILELLKRLSEELGISLVLVSHDMSVVAGLADEIAVMYGGHVVEHGETVQLFDQPAHPYTRGLLASIPDATADPDAPLIGIPGQPPDLRRLDRGCIFRQRCTFTVSTCAEASPPLEIRHSGQRAACWVDVDTVTGQGAAHGPA